MRRLRAAWRVLRHGTPPPPPPTRVTYTRGTNATTTFYLEGDRTR